MKMSQYFRVNKSHTKYNTITRKGDNGQKGLFLLFVRPLMTESELILVPCGPHEWVTMDTFPESYPAWLPDLLRTISPHCSLILFSWSEVPYL